MDIKSKEQIIVQEENCRENGLIHASSLFLEMQRGAGINAEMLHVGYHSLQEQGLFFALTRTHMEIYSPIRCEDTLFHETWPGIVNRFFFPRYHRFMDQSGNVLAAATSLWVTLSIQERRIVSPLNTGICFPDTSEFPEPVRISGKIPSCDGIPKEKNYIPLSDDFDINSHVNNVSYIRWLENELDPLIPGNAFISDLNVGYEKEIRERTPVHFLLSAENSKFSFHVTNSAGIRHFAAGGTIKEL